MSRNGLMGILVIAACVLAVSVMQASGDTGKVGDDLIYDYYAIRGGENFMTVSVTTTSCAMPLPTGKRAFTYTPVVDPVPDCNPAKARPIGVGDIAGGGDGLDLEIVVGPFAAPVDVSFGLFAAAFDATDIYFINRDNYLTSVQDELLSELEAGSTSPSKSSNGQGNGQVGNNGNGNGQDPDADNPKPKKKFRKLTVWRSDVTNEVKEPIVTALDAAEILPPGLYVVILNVTRASPADDNFDRFYRWITYFIVPD